MKRIQVILAVAALLVAMFVATAAPAMAMVRGAGEERGESARVQANEERGFNHNFFNPAFNTGGLFISNGNVGGLGNFGFGGLNGLGFGCGFFSTFGCNTGFIV